MSTQNYLDRFLEPVAEAFTPELANRIIAIRADDELQSRIDDLRRKANQGKLSADE